MGAGRRSDSASAPLVGRGRIGDSSPRRAGAGDSRRPAGAWPQPGPLRARGGLGAGGRRGVGRNSMGSEGANGLRPPIGLMFPRSGPIFPQTGPNEGTLHGPMRWHKK